MLKLELFLLILENLGINLYNGREEVCNVRGLVPQYYKAFLN